jgi:transposase-like protein
MKKLIPEPFLCPRCASAAVRRSHRRGVERLLSLLAIYPFRCKSCHSRFWRLAVGIRGSDTARLSHTPRATRGEEGFFDNYN